MIYLSLILPAYNEGSRIGPTLDKIGDFLSKKSYDYEVILVDDGSVDNTIAVAEKSRLYKEDKLRIIKNGKNRGKGFSVKNGIFNSSGEYILFSDADLSTPIEEVDKLFGAINNGYDIVIGSRALKESQVIISQPWYRETMGKVFNLFVKSIVLKGFNDTQCGFKLFKSDTARYIASRLKIEGFSFDVEMLYIAIKKGYNIKEMPVVWLNSARSKVSPILDSARMFLDLIKIKTIHG